MNGLGTFANKWLAPLLPRASCPSLSFFLSFRGKAFTAGAAGKIKHASMQLLNYLQDHETQDVLCFHVSPSARSGYKPMPVASMIPNRTDWKDLAEKGKLLE